MVILFQLFVAVSLLCQAANVVCGADITASVSYASHEVIDQVLPDSIIVTLEVSDVLLTALELTRVPYLAQTVPVYSLNVDSAGQFVHTEEKIRERKNIGLYQDLGHRALIQVTRSDVKVDGQARLEMTGQLTIADTRYLLSPSKQGNKSSFQHISVKHSILKNGKEADIYTLHKLTRPAILHDTLLKIPKLRSQEDVSRQRRQSSSNYYVDVVAVVDFKAYRKFFSAAGSRTATFQAIQQKYAYVFNEVDIMYGSINSPNYRIHVRLVKIVVSETAQTSTFSESERIPNATLDRVDADKVLDKIKVYVAGPARNTLVPNDHVMVFTGYDMFRQLKNGTKENLAGLAFGNTTCHTDGGSSSLVEDHGDYECVHTAAHELGHSLSADHDGEMNSCRESDQYIMTPQPEHVSNGVARLHPWLFSPCSIAYFRKYIDTQMKSTQGVVCLTQTLVVTGNIPDVTNHLLGQEILPDQQCKLMYGPKSQYCRDSVLGNISDICSNMACNNPDDATLCHIEQALYGTTCGSGKVCIEGSCVHHTGAPVVDESCVFGDAEGIVANGMTCGQLIHSESGHCYNEWYRVRCCASCKAVQRTGDCAFGDWVGTTVNKKSCNEAITSYNGFCYTDSIRKDCCGSCRAVEKKVRGCEYGDHYTSGCKVEDCLTETNMTGCCGTCNYDPDVCVDHNVMVNKMSCYTAAIMKPSMCSDPNVNHYCCATCRALRSGSLARCADVPGASVQGQTCSSLASTNVKACYAKDVMTSCCGTCKQHITSFCVDDDTVTFADQLCTAYISKDNRVCVFTDPMKYCCKSCLAANILERGT